jgi:hypothetical protein
MLPWPSVLLTFISPQDAAVRGFGEVTNLFQDMCGIVLAQ